MSRSGYTDDHENHWEFIRWRGAVASAIRGKRGQAFLREVLAALDALPEKKLITEELAADGAYCTLGAVGKTRGMDMELIDPEDRKRVAGVFGIPHSLACEIMFENDEGSYHGETPEQRFARMRRWIEKQLIEWSDA